MLDLTPAWQITLEVVGWVGAGIVVWSMMQQRLLRLRVYNLIGCLVQVLYNGALGVWPVMALNIVLSVVQVINLAKMRRERHDPTAYAVAEVPARGPFLTHLLDRHRSDIERFHPGFVQPSAGARAYAVLSEDETVGYVVLHDAGDGVAQIELDYVTEKYRNLTPGEFVFRESGVLVDDGFRQVVSAPDSIDPYYERIGFQQRGDRYVLDLEPSAA